MQKIEMKSGDIKNLRGTKSKKKILFINPIRENNMSSVPHNGLAMLGAVLKKRGHEVLIVDYMFLRRDSNVDISHFIGDFDPDIVGVSIYTPNVNEANAMIDRVRKLLPDAPLMVGGPHPTLYGDLLENDKRIDYIVKGEAELVIVKTVEFARREKKPKTIRAKEIVDVNDLPFSDYTCFYKYREIRGYPIMTSRGCPNRCSFCASAGLSYRRWRCRDPENCIKELELAKKVISPYISVYVMDDNPTVWKERFHKFLELYAVRIKSPIYIVNTRADGVDDKLLILMKKCGCHSLAIGVEHANPEVFSLINKGETLGQIEEACKLIKKHKMELILSFVIGLPGDNLERMRDNVKFCKMVKSDAYSINQLVPYRATFAREWLEEHGAKIDNEVGHEAQRSLDFESENPVVETTDFSKEDRKKAYYIFLLGVAHQRLKLRKILRIFKIAKHYGILSDFFFWIPHGIITSLRNKKNLFDIALHIFKTEGFFKLVHRWKNRNKGR